MDDFFSITYRVPYADTDQMGVVYYANYFIYFERIRNEILRAGNILYSELEEKNIMLPVVSAHCDYKSPSFYDDLITIKVRLSKFQGCRATFEYELIARGKLLATGYTTHATINKQTRKAIPIPPILLKFIEEKKYLQK